MDSLLPAVVLGAPSIVVGAASAAAWLGLYPPTPRDLGGARDLDSEAERVRIGLPDGDSVDGWFLAGRGVASGLLLHGFGRTHHRVWRYAGFLRSAGYDLLAIDFRSSRGRGRKPTTLGLHEQRDACAALDWLAARTPGRPLFLLGESLGGTVALLAAAGEPRVSGVVVDCPFATGREAVEDMLGRFLRLPRRPSAAVAREVTRWITGHDLYQTDALPAAVALKDRPILFIHSVADERLSPLQSQRLWEAAGSKDPMWSVPGAGHNQAWMRHRAEYERRVLGFLEETLRRH